MPMINETGGYFRPLDKQGKDAIKSGGGILVYSYRDNDPNILDTSIVAKPPGFPDQHIIGPQITVVALAKAFLLLDSLQPSNSFRQINIVVNGEFDFEKHEYRSFKKPSFTSDQLGRFGIQETLKGTQYKKRVGDLPGICPDVMHPRFLCSDYSSNKTWSSFFLSAYYASVVVHEWTHVEQVRNSLPTNSTWAERAAMTNQVRFLFDLLSSGALKREDEKNVVIQIQALSIRIQNYRNGIGFYDHLKGKTSNYHGSPIKDQTLHTEDFQFGY